MQQRPAGIIFDLYETLITEFDPHWKPTPSIAAQLGIDEASFARLWDQLQLRRMTGAIPDFAAALHEICRATGYAPPEALIAHLLQERVAIKARAFAHIEPSIVAMARQLNHWGIRLGLLSNATGEEVAAWDRCVLAPLFDDAVFSYQVGLVKPDRRMYVLACQRLGIAPETTLFVGDGGSDELSGAARAGLTPYWASWFLERWPSWKRSSALRERAIKFAQAPSPEALIQIVASLGMSTAG